MDFGVETPQIPVPPPSPRTTWNGGTGMRGDLGGFPGILRGFGFFFPPFPVGNLKVLNVLLENWADLGEFGPFLGGFGVLL